MTLAVIFGRKISQIIRCLKVKYTDTVREFYAKEYEALGNVARCEVTYILLLLVENIKYIAGIKEIEPQKASPKEKWSLGLMDSMLPQP